MGKIRKEAGVIF